MATTTNYSWSTPDNTALVKDGAAAIRSLGTAIDTTVFNNAGAAIPKSLVDAAGDLLIGTADNTVGKLTIGTASQQLRVNSGATSLEYFTPTVAGGMTLISETVASANSSISFSSISGTYKQLLLVWSGIVHSTTGSDFTLRFNNDDTANAYQAEGIRVKDTTIAISGSSGTSLKSEVGGSNVFTFGTSVNGDFGSATLSNGVVLIDNYASSSKFKTIEANYSYYDNSAANYLTANCLFVYQSQTAITSLDIVRLSGTATISNKTNTTIRLYGVA
jgi:hypothetical protein